MEAISLPTVTAKSMAEFINKKLINRSGKPHHIVSDNSIPFHKEIADLLEEEKIEHHKSSPYRPQANGAVEAATRLSRRSWPRR